MNKKKIANIEICTEKHGGPIYQRQQEDGSVKIYNRYLITLGDNNENQEQVMMLQMGKFPLAIGEYLTYKLDTRFQQAGIYKADMIREEKKTTYQGYQKASTYPFKQSYQKGNVSEWEKKKQKLIVGQNALTNAVNSLSYDPNLPKILKLAKDDSDNVLIDYICKQQTKLYNHILNQNKQDGTE